MSNRTVPKSSKLGSLGLITIIVIGTILLPMGSRASNTQKQSRGRGDSLVKPIKSVNEFDDVRSKDLSKLDLSSRKGLIATLKFNQGTVWPEQAKMPPGCDPDKILTVAMNPGLGVRELHKQGITGKGVNVAIIDQPLFPDHPEYDGKIVVYHDTGCDTDKSSMHGPAVASLLVGTNCGTAPDARIYYAAAPSWKRDAAYYAKGLDWIIAQNEKLPEEEKIRVVSVSASPNQSSWANRQMWDRACARAEADGIMVLDCTDSHRGFINRGWYNPEDPESVSKFNLGPPPKREFRVDPTEMSLYVPSSCRTVAQHYDYHGRNSYIYCGRGGLSWSIPYCAGVLAMGWQIRPDLTPAQMKDLLFASAYVHESGAKIINPTAFIDLIRKQSDNQHIQTHLQTYSETRTIVPGVRVGDYTLDMSKDEVLKELGEPETIQLGEDEVVRRGEEKYSLDNLPSEYVLAFGDISFWISDSSLEAISVRSPLYKLSNGLGVGDSEQKIKQAFGEDFQLEEALGKDFRCYHARGLAFAIHKKNRTVAEIVIYQPEGDRSERDAPDQQEQSKGTIVPGVGMSDYTLVMNKDDVLRRLGKPKNIHLGGEDYTLDNLPKRYFMFYDDISFFIDEEAVTVISTGSPRYKFANGLKVGDSQDRIIQAFGSDFELEEFERIDTLTYEDKGLYFEIDKENGTVEEISVNQVKRNQSNMNIPKVHRRDDLGPYEDVSGKDLRGSDLRYSEDILDTLEFNQETQWPPSERLPEGFDPQVLLQEGMNPGLDVWALHAQRITGAGVHVGLIDQPLLLDHPEYDGKIVSYHNDCGSHKSSMHGPAMASQLVGKRCGTAPGASLHVVAVPSWKADAGYYARALDRFVTYNENAPKDKRIRVVSVSCQPSGEGSVYKNQPLWDEAVQRAQVNGILVLDCTWHHGFVSLCWLDPQDRESVEACTPGFRNGAVEVDEGHIHVPSAPRTGAEADEDRPFGYAYDGGGRRSRRPKAKNGYSDTIPYAAGILALGWQVRPDLTPTQIKEMLFASAHVHESGAKIIDPAAFIDLIRNKSDNQNIQTHPQTHSGTQTIVPGVGVGDYTLGMSKDKVLNKLRRPEGISFVKDDGVVKEISVSSPLYKFTNGLAVGDSEDKIKQAFGNDFQLEEFEGMDVLIYEEKGLRFEIDKKKRTVEEISVNQAKRNESDSDAPDSGKEIMLSEQSPGPITFPKIDRKPRPDDEGLRVLRTLPKYDPDSGNLSKVDLRCCDLSRLDLRNSTEVLMHARFDDRTVWPAPHRTPSDFDWHKIMELGKNPGLGVRSLHRKGITGRGVSVAIIDQPLLVNHQEYAERVRLYEEIDLQGRTRSSGHGVAVASIAVGKTSGVAPEAELYYIAQYNIDWDKGTGTLRTLAQGIHRIVEINEQLPKDNKIRVISISKGWSQSNKDYEVITKAVQKARVAGMLIVCTSMEFVHEGCDFDALGRSPLADPDVFESYIPGWFRAKSFWAGHSFPSEGFFWVPMDSRATGNSTDNNEYVFYRTGGFSWAVPYIAGVYALAVQVDPAITPERFWALAARTGRTIELEREGKRRPLGPIIDPVRLIGSIKAGELSNLNRKQSDNQQSDRRSSKDVLTLVRKAAAEGRILFKLTTPEEFKEIVGQPTREEVGNRSGTRVNLFYPGFITASFFGWPDEPRTLGQVWCEGRQIDIGQNRPVVLRDEGDLSRFGKYNNICGADLSRLDLSQKGDLLERMTFDSLTVWPKPDRLPRGFEPGRRIEEGKNPGLGVRSLHQEGINGSGVCIAIVDGILRRDHIEYSDRIKSYHVREAEGGSHAPPVCSIAVGKTCGVAPGASLHFYGVLTGDNRRYARAVEQIVGRNRNLPSSEKVRVISISIGVSQKDHYDQWRAVADKAEKAGILVVTCDKQDFMPYGTLKQKVGKDTDDPNNHDPSYLSGDGNALVYVPIGNRSMASHRGKDVYTFDTYGGNSWAAPYLAGLAALAFQVHPGISPDEIVGLWQKTATPTKIGPVVNPRRFIEAVKRLR